ncbi:putative protein kinase RLK-Pelle-WAK family [Helianthus annuus]|nr:putative protein kinase RLK-Pelle-WAK family [Helianthus annuus]
MSKKRKQLMLKQKFFQQNGALLLEDKLKNGVGSINIFRAEEIEKATTDFADYMIIGRGGYGTVYKGVLPDNRVVAIKRSRISDESQMELFINEILIPGRINHRNVRQSLSSPSYNSSTRRVSWDSRLRIAHESAGALAYLHSDATMTIIHRDVKSANILLDENYTAKVADFGCSKSLQLEVDDPVTTLVQGTLGYLDPEYFHTSQLTEKSDVYSFGVVLAELIIGSKPISMERPQEERNLAAYFLIAEREDRLIEIIDPHVFEEAATDEQLEAACSLACRCLHMEGKKRPSMKEVTMELERIRKIRNPLDSEVYDENLSD